GNDVTLYSVALGAWLADQELPLAVRPEHAADYGFIARTLDTPIDRAASVMLASRLSTTVGQRAPYYIRMREAYAEQWSVLHGETVARLRKTRLRLASFGAEDVYTWIDRVPKEAAVITYPPFFAGDY